METLFSIAWENMVERNTEIVDQFTELVNQDPELKAHRDYIEQHAYGFGERAFHWLWKLAVDSMPQNFRFLEIGVYKGQVLSLVRLLADRTGKDAEIVGVTPLSSFAGVTGKFTDFPDEDYAKHIHNLHAYLNVKRPTIIKGDSTDKAVIEKVWQTGEYDMVYIDGCHELDYVMKDISHYAPLVKDGGLLMMDDSSNNLAMPWGYFCGIADVSQAVTTLIETNKQWRHLLAVMHLRTFQRMGK